MNTLVDLYLSWFKMGLFTFGGGYAMLPMIEKEVIEKHKWASESDVIDYYAIGQCTPGIIAVNTATFVGYKVKKVPGAIASTLGVITPSIIIITLIASIISNFQNLPIVQNALKGISIAVCVLMIISIEKLLKKNVKNIFSFTLVVLAFILAYFTDISMVILVIFFGTIGYLYSKIKRKKNE